MLSCALGYSKTWRLAGSVAKSVPAFEFRVQIHGSDSSGEGEGNPIEWIEILSGGKTVQMIRFSQDDDAPTDFGEMKEIVSLKDVDCDGYKDLLVLKDVGYGGVNTWYFLFRYNVRSGKFERYTKFEELPFREVNCRTKLVQTHNREGWAGCLYEEGTYRWVNGKLDPVRLEVSDAGDDNNHVVREVYAWVKGKKRLQSRRSYPIDDCHATSGSSRR